MHPHDRLAGEIKKNLDSLENPVYFYDSDWDGATSQAIANIIGEYKGIDNIFHWINYSETSKAISFAREKKPKEVVFLDYEPHEKEFAEICRDAESIIILGHHIRPDIKALEARDSRVKYLNPRDYIDSSIKREGLPIAYFMHKAAGLYRINTTFQASLGLRGYGFAELAKPIERQSGLYVNYKKANDYIKNSLMLISYRFENCSLLVDVLEKSESYEKNRMSEIFKKLEGPPDIKHKYNMIMDSAKDNIAVFETDGRVGDLIVYVLMPKNGDYFEQIKIFLHDPFDKGLHDHAVNLGYKTSLSINCIKDKRKASLRSARSGINIAQMLEKTFKSLPGVEKNYGGHENSGGFICTSDNVAKIAKSFINNYFETTGQDILVRDEDLLPVR